jgi:hypothetical protein
MVEGLLDLDFLRVLRHQAPDRIDVASAEMKLSLDPVRIVRFLRLIVRNADLRNVESQTRGGRLFGYVGERSDESLSPVFLIHKIAMGLASADSEEVGLLGDEEDPGHGISLAVVKCRVR